jgi:hypothetical protein
MDKSYLMLYPLAIYAPWGTRKRRKCLILTYSRGVGDIGAIIRVYLSQILSKIKYNNYSFMQPINGHRKR